MTLLRQVSPEEVLIWFGEGGTLSLHPFTPSRPAIHLNGGTILEVTDHTTPSVKRKEDLGGTLARETNRRCLNHAMHTQQSWLLTAISIGPRTVDSFLRYDACVMAIDLL